LVEAVRRFVGWEIELLVKYWIYGVDLLYEERATNLPASVTLLGIEK
jgi:hypothetical protein